MHHSIFRRMASTCIAAAWSRAPVAKLRPMHLAMTSLRGPVLCPHPISTPAGGHYQHATLSIAAAAIAQGRPAVSSTPAAAAVYSRMTERLEDLAEKWQADSMVTDALYIEAQSKALELVCSQLTEYLRASGRQLTPKQLVQLAGTTKRLHLAMGPSDFARSPAQDMTCALIDAAIASPAMQAKGGADLLVSWSMLLHGLAPVQASTPSMQQLLKKAMAWYEAQGIDVWTVKVGAHALKPATISLTLWAFATCKYKGDLKPLIAGVNAAAEAHILRGASPQEWCTTIWAAAKLGITATAIDPVWRRAAPAITGSFRRAAFVNAQDISMAMYAAGFSDPKFTFARMFTVGLRNMIGLDRWSKHFHAASPQATATILLSISKMMPRLLAEKEHPEWAVDANVVVEKCIAAQETQLKRMISPGTSLQPLITTVSAMASLRMFVSKLFTAALKAHLERVPSKTASKRTSSSEHAQPTGQEEQQPADSLTEVLNSTEGQEASSNPSLLGRSEQADSSDAGAEGGMAQAGAAGSPSAWKSWSLDSVTLLFAYAQVYPGLAHGLQLMLADRARQAAKKASAPAKQPASAKKAGRGVVNEETGEVEDVDGDDGPPVETQMLVGLYTDVQAWLRGTYNLMAKLDISSLEEWDAQMLANFLWAWAALLPSSFQYAKGLPGAGVQQGLAGAAPARSATGQLSQQQDQAAGSNSSADSGSSTSPPQPAQQGRSLDTNMDISNHPKIAEVVAAVFQECERRGAAAFTEEGLTQVFTAHLEAKERNLTRLGPAALDPNSKLISAGRALWHHRVQALSNTDSSRSQKELFEGLKELGYKVELEALTPPGSSEPSASGAGESTGEGDEQQAQQAGEAQAKPKRVKRGSPPPEVAPAAGGLEPIRTDILITALPSGKPCNIAVEFDGPLHFMLKPRNIYTGASALRHAQLQRRADHLLLVSHKEWSKMNRGAKLKERKKRQLAYLEVIMKPFLSK